VYDYDQHYLIWLNDNVKLKDEIKESVEDWLADSDPIC